MNATEIGEERHTTLPLEISEAAGLKAGDMVEWRFEDGEIRGRKLEAQQSPPKVRLVRENGYLVAETSRMITHAEVRKLLNEFP